MGERENRCKCADSFGDFLSNTAFLKERVRNETFPPITDFTLFTPQLYNDIKKVEDFCNIDIRRTESSYLDIFTDISKMRPSIIQKDTDFGDEKTQVLKNLNIMEAELRKKIRECSVL